MLKYGIKSLGAARVGRLSYLRAMKQQNDMMFNNMNNEGRAPMMVAYTVTNKRKVMMDTPCKSHTKVILLMWKFCPNEGKMCRSRPCPSREWLIHKKKFSGMTDVRRMAYLCTVDVDDEVTANRGQGMRSCSSEGLIPYVQFSKAVSVRLKPYLCIRFQTATARTWRD